jgi:hypothetical protein
MVFSRMSRYLPARIRCNSVEEPLPSTIKFRHALKGRRGHTRARRFSYVSAFEMSILASQNAIIIDGVPSGQYVDKNNCKRRVRDGKEWESTGKPLKSGGCNLRKGNLLTFLLVVRFAMRRSGVRSPATPPINPPNLNNLHRASASQSFLHCDVEIPINTSCDHLVTNGLTA